MKIVVRLWKVKTQNVHNAGIALSGRGIFAPNVVQRDYNHEEEKWYEKDRMGSYIIDFSI